MAGTLDESIDTPLVFDDQPMATFVYVTSEKSVNTIRATGLLPTQPNPAAPDGICAIPVTPNAQKTYQWQQTLRHRGRRNLCRVYFQIPDAELVWISLYNERYRATTAAEAVGLVNDNLIPDDFQVIIPRQISRGEIRQIRFFAP